LKSGKAGKARLEITFDVNIEGILTMSARDLDTGKQMKRPRFASHPALMLESGGRSTPARRWPICMRIQS